jgi:hypothetical protein
LGKELNEAHKGGSFGIHGDEGLFAALPPPSKSLPLCMSHPYFVTSCTAQQYMLEMVDARKNADKGEERYDLFSGLLDAAQDEQDNGVALSDDELIGGPF